jgi:hypothetical protein
MIQPLNKRTRRALQFVAAQKAVSYTHLGQFLAPNFEPAIDEEKPDSPQSKTRGGNLRNVPWPQDRHKRLKAVSRLVDEWDKEDLVQKEQPWRDDPKWVWVTEYGLRRLGLSYNDAHWYDEEELNHLYQITRVRLMVGRKPSDPEASWFAHTWISEREIESEFPFRETGITLPHLPDGAMELDEDAEVKMAGGEKLPFRRGDCIGVEVERSRKDFARLDGILPDLLRNYQGVWYFCRPKAADAVHATIDRLLKAETLTPDQAKLIRVLDLEER